MAKLKALPTKATIDTLSGVIDYYVYMGIPCARSWPRYRRERYPESSFLPNAAFTYINQIAGTLPPNIIDAYKQQASATRLTWKDVAIRCYLSGDKV